MANVRRITYTAFGNANTYLVSFDGESDALLVDCSRSYKTVKKICEDCGFQNKEKVKIRNTGGWYRTLCERCFNSYIQKKNEGKV